MNTSIRLIRTPTKQLAAAPKTTQLFRSKQSTPSRASEALADGSRAAALGHHFGQVAGASQKQPGHRNRLGAGIEQFSGMSIIQRMDRNYEERKEGSDNDEASNSSDHESDESEEDSDQGEGSGSDAEHSSDRESDESEEGSDNDEVSNSNSKASSTVSTAKLRRQLKATNAQRGKKDSSGHGRGKKISKGHTGDKHQKGQDRKTSRKKKLNQKAENLQSELDKRGEGDGETRSQARKAKKAQEDAKRKAKRKERKGD